MPAVGFCQILISRRQADEIITCDFITDCTESEKIIECQSTKSCFSRESVRDSNEPGNFFLG